MRAGCRWDVVFQVQGRPRTAHTTCINTIDRIQSISQIVLTKACYPRAISEDITTELPKTLPESLGPFAEQRHEAATEHHAGERIQQLPEARLAHLRAEQELVGEKLDESRVQEDARAEAVEDTGDQDRASRFRVVRRAHTEAHCDAHGRRYAVEE